METLDECASASVACAMFVADFASHFSIQLGVRSVSYAELAPALAARCVLPGREPLWDLYEGLMRFVLNVRTPPLCAVVPLGRLLRSLMLSALMQPSQCHRPGEGWRRQQACRALWKGTC